MGAGLVGGPVGLGAGLGLTGLGIGTDLVGGYLKGQAEQKQLAAKQQADLQNQQLAENQAADALQRGSFEAGALRMKAGAMTGQQRVGYGASGVDVNTGSAASVQAGTRAMSELDVQTLTNNAARQAWGYKVTASQYGQQAAMDKQAMGEAKTASILGAVGGGLGGLGTMLNDYQGRSRGYAGGGGGYGGGGYDDAGKIGGAE